MPPKLPRTSKLFRAAPIPFICPICRHKQAFFTFNGGIRSYKSRRERGLGPQNRTASTIPSVTAVNVKREIPSAFQELYGALKALESEAGVYVNTSQLQLALRGVESENAVIRVAGENYVFSIGRCQILMGSIVLGLNGQSGARRLAKALLADPLAAEQGWETQLTGSDEGDGKALILR